MSHKSGGRHSDRLRHGQRNWLETSCSAMLTYTMSKAVARGSIASSYADVAARGFRGVMEKLSLGADGSTNVADICIGTSVGDAAYSFNRMRATNDFHGLGAFLIMYEQLAEGCNFGSPGDGG
jgi:unsaturated rhamnogalacturonyl hydrolase